MNTESPKSPQSESSFIKKFALPISVLINLLCFTLTYFFFDALFNTNDDPGQMAQVAGFIRVGESSPFLTYSHVLIGKILQLLYGNFPNFNWYPAFLVGTLYTAHVGFLYLLLKKNAHWISVLLYFGYFGLLGVNLLVNLQFSISASICCTSGLLLLFNDFLSNNNETNNKGSVLISGILLFSLGVMIRFTGASLIALLMITASGISLALNRFKNWKSFGIKTIITFILLIGIDKTNEMLWKIDDDQSDFYSFQQVRGKLSGNKPLDVLSFDERKKILQEISWSSNDYNCLNYFFVTDEDVFSTEKLTFLLSKAPFIKKISFTKVSKNIGEIFADLSAYSAIIFALLLIPFLFREPLKVVRLMFYVALVIAILFLINYLFRTPPPRIYFGLFVLLVWKSLLLVKTKKRVTLRSMMIPLLIFGVAGVFIAKQMGQQFEKKKEMQYKNQMVHNYCDQLRRIGKENLFVSWGASFPWEFIKPFEDLSFIKDLSIFSIGSVSRDPASMKLLDNFEIDKLGYALATREDIYLIAGGTIRNQRLKTFIKEHHDLTVDYEEVFTSVRFTIFRLRSSIK